MCYHPWMWITLHGPPGHVLWARLIFLLMDIHNFTIYHVIQNDVFIIIIILLTCLILPFQALCHLLRLSQLQKCPVSIWFTFPDVVITMDAMPWNWPSYLLCSDFPLSFCWPWAESHWHVHIAFQNTVVIWFELSCIKWSFVYLVYLLSYIWIIVLLKITYVIHVVQYFSSFQTYLPHNASI